MILVSVFNSLSIHWTYGHDIGTSINFNSLSIHRTYEHDIGISISLSIYLAGSRYRCSNENTMSDYKRTNGVCPFKTSQFKNLKKRLKPNTQSGETTIRHPRTILLYGMYDKETDGTRYIWVHELRCLCKLFVDSPTVWLDHCCAQEKKNIELDRTYGAALNSNLQR